jgi:hypothetical protein
MKVFSFLFIYISFFCLTTEIAFATVPDNPNTKTDSLRKDALRVFIDCPFCQFGYLMENIPFVNYVREVGEADVYINISSQKNGTGGPTYTIFITGQKRFANMTDTLFCQQTPYLTSDESRIDFVNTLKIGLMRYVAKTPLVKSVSIDYAFKGQKSNVQDKWKSWVFSISTNGSLHNEATYKSQSLSTAVNANKTTQEYKFKFWASTYYNNGKYKVDSGYTSVTNRSLDIGNRYVKSISDHWSVGETANYSSNTYYNIKSAYSLFPAIEYDYFPYSDYNRRQLRFLYKIGYVHHNYIDTTIYNKIESDIYLHSLAATFQMIEKWGSATTSLSTSNYLTDFEKNNLSLWASIGVRVFKGLSVYLSGSSSLIHDQVYLAKGAVSSDDVLLRQRQLQTQYVYAMNFGVSYTFGSMINNVINPRFGD